jgi:hypothetical protein
MSTTRPSPIRTLEAAGMTWTSPARTATSANFTFGPNLGTTSSGGGYDVLINHNPYEIQAEWPSVTAHGEPSGAAGLRLA